MAKYRPGTANDAEYIARTKRKHNRETDNALFPTGSQVYATTEKMQSMDGRLSDIDKTAQDALSKAEEALNKTVTEYEFVDLTDEQIKAMFEEVA